MRKIFLTTTILFIASSALAFSGLVGGGSGSGSKSATYTGGVNAIGVHFNGRKSSSQPQEAEETCPVDKKCGTGCCQGDNVCHQNESGEYECCNEDLSHCCPTNQGVYQTYYSDNLGNSYPMNTCCNGSLYCSSRNTNGECTSDYNHCCENGKVYKYGSFPYGDAYQCCYDTLYKGIGINGTDLCCHEGEDKTCAEYDSNNNCLMYVCCPSGYKGYCARWDNDGNCAYTSCYTGRLYCREHDSEGNCTNMSYCAENGIVSCVAEYENGICRKSQCCDVGETAYCWQRDEEGYCPDPSCCSGTVTLGIGVNGADKCCDEGETGYCYSRDSEGNCTGAACCSGTVSKGTGTNGADQCINQYT